MKRVLADLESRPNLYTDDYYEDFRDVLTDNCHPELLPGVTQAFGNGCRLEVVYHEPITARASKNIVADVIEGWGWDPDTVTLVHSMLLLHMQAEENIKIDIIWKVDEAGDQDEPTDYTPIGVFFEDNGEGAFDDGPNFDPSDNANWEEFLYDMGIVED